MKPNFCIISNNCWGAEYYREKKINYNTPFVGLFVHPECFVKLCNDLVPYLKTNLKFIEHSKYEEYSKIIDNKKYPIGLLNDIEIHFLHYNSNAEAQSKWIRRVSRIDFNNVTFYIKGCDRDIINFDLFAEKWNKIKFEKIFFSAKERKIINNSIRIYESEDDFVIDGLALYNISKKYFDIEDWKKKEISLWSIVFINIRKWAKRLLKNG